MATLFEYIDESGQDTGGALFIAAALITSSEREQLLPRLEQIELESKKENRKWHGSDPRYRRAYIEKMGRLKELKGKLFFEKFSDRKDYMAMTAKTAADALRTQVGDKAIVYVDGLFKSQVPVFKKYLKRSVHMKTQIKGVRKDENNAFIRLVDVICGLVRDAHQGNEWAQALLKRLIKRGVLKEL